ncbi:MAG: sigma factor-like helix-turn-helix DNA-binding protein [Candidatus Gracilibacteria bacterium]
MTTDSSTIFSTTPSDLNETHLKEIVEKLLLVLSEKERYIIQHRFAIGMDSRKTLEAIGKHFGVTRERIRQIEKNAFRKLKRNAFNTQLKMINEVAKGIIKKHGGLLIETKLISIILNTLKNISPEDINPLKLSLTLDPELTKIANTLDFEPHWRYNSIKLPTLRKISEVGSKLLADHKDVIDLKTITQKVKNIIPNEEIIDALVASVLEIDKKTKFVKEGVGLKEWRHINPRTLRDKINFILEHDKKPLHFEEISQKIRDLKFDSKRINVQAVHNELIRNDHFILIGRGIYALDKWGYKSGTVGEVLESILKDGKAKTREEIMRDVLKQRQVKKITIYLNLKSNAKIKALDGDRYQWVK